MVDPSLQSITFTPQAEQRKRLPRPPEPGDLSAPPAEPPVFKSELVSALWERLQSKPPSWEVSARITNPLPSVAATRDELRRATPSLYGRREHSRLVSAGHGENPPRFDVMIGKASVDRAVRLVHTLTRAMTEIGVRIDTGNGRYGHTPRPVITLFDVRLQLRVRELTTRKPHTPTPDELAEQARYKFARIDKWDYEPNGSLRVSIANPDDRHDRRAWADGKARRVEEMVEEIVTGFLLEVDAELDRARRAEERRIQEAEHWRRQRELEQLRKEEEARVNRLVAEAERWERAARIRRYVTAVLEEHTDPVPESIERWASWAMATADRIDPIAREAKADSPAHHDTSGVDPSALSSTSSPASVVDP